MFRKRKVHRARIVINYLLQKDLIEFGDNGIQLSDIGLRDFADRFKPWLNEMYDLAVTV